MRARARMAVLAAALLLTGGLVAGDAGALTALQVVTALALVALLVELPRPARPRRAGQPRTAARQGFPSYDRVLSAVVGARQSARVVDLQLRPVLERLVAANVEQHGEARVRAALGEQVWWLADPHRPARSDSRSGGLDRDELHRVVERMEAL